VGGRFVKVSASLYAADPLRLAEAAAAVAPYVASFHVDVMDGRFAPAFGCGESLISRLVADGVRPVDVHLMIDEPQRWARRFAGLGARRVIFHAEAVSDPMAVANEIRAEGSLAYVALLPDTPIARHAALLERVDGLLLLTAPPGGGKFNQVALARSREAPVGLPLIVDGGLEPQHFDSLRSCSAELAVIGKALFAARDLGEWAKTLALLASGATASGA
jgi:ribulose-phosphate 3-epimerase